MRKFYYSAKQALNSARNTYFLGSDDLDSLFDDTDKPLIRHFVDGKEFTSREDLSEYFDDMVEVPSTKGEITTLVISSVEIFDYMQKLEEEQLYGTLS